MTSLQRRLAALGDELAWPPTPDLAEVVGTRVAAEARPQHARARRVLVAAAAGLAVLVLTLGVALASSSRVRATVRDWLGLGVVEVQRVQRLPDLAPARTLDLGRRTTLEAGRRAFGADVGTLVALGAPDAVYIDRAVPGRALSQVYVARPDLPATTAGVGALLQAFRGSPFTYLRKLVGTGTPIDRVRVRGAPGFWIGGTHEILLLDRGGAVLEERARLAAHALVWVRDGVTFRLETPLDRQAALRLAAGVR
jgi:hypothetical protein